MADVTIYPEEGGPVENLAHKLFRPVVSYDVGQYHPEPCGRGEPTMVLLWLNIEGEPPLVLRLKTEQAAKDLIAALQRSTSRVWGRRKN